MYIIIKKYSSLICTSRDDSLKHSRISDTCLIFLFEKSSRSACKSDRKHKGGLEI